MTYKLSLTQDEIQAFEWVGNRYPTGYEFLNHLTDDKVSVLETEDGFEYTIPEHTAWALRDLISEATEDFRTDIPCFSSELSAKLYDFAYSIV